MKILYCCCIGIVVFLWLHIYSCIAYIENMIQSMCGLLFSLLSKCKQVATHTYISHITGQYRFKDHSWACSPVLNKTFLYITRPYYVGWKQNVKSPSEKPTYTANCIYYKCWHLIAQFVYWIKKWKEFNHEHKCQFEYSYDLANFEASEVFLNEILFYTIRAYI